MQFSSWSRDYRKQTATRPDGNTLLRAEDDTGWVHRFADTLVPLKGYPGDLDAAIAHFDKLNPPDGWRLVQGSWIAIGWLVRPGKNKDGDACWLIYRSSSADDDVKQATKTPFKSADRARRWCELRKDREGARLRGPKPRAGQRADANFPDVRCTPTERAVALDLAQKLGIPFAEMSRLSIDVLRTLVEGDDVWLGRMPNGQIVWAARDGALPTEAKRIKVSA